MQQRYDNRETQNSRTGVKASTKDSVDSELSDRKVGTPALHHRSRDYQPVAPLPKPATAPKQDDAFAIPLHLGTLESAESKAIEIQPPGLNGQRNASF